ncbi:MAG: hypothetical protein QW096_09165 [Thermofilaceae archaeon]
MNLARITSIYLFGPDGSGKTTLIRLFRNYMYVQGVYVYTSWFRGTHLLASLLARFLSSFRLFKGLDNPYYKISIPSQLRNLWVFIEFVSFIPHYLLRKLISLIVFVLGDRGTIDFIVWIMLTLNYYYFPRTLIGEFLLRLASKDKAIYVTAEPSTLLKRVIDTPTLFLLREIVYYRVLAKYYAECLVDTTLKKPSESLHELLKCLQAL